MRARASPPLPWAGDQRDCGGRGAPRQEFFQGQLLHGRQAQVGWLGFLCAGDALPMLLLLLLPRTITTHVRWAVMRRVRGRHAPGACTSCCTSRSVLLLLHDMLQGLDDPCRWWLIAAPGQSAKPSQPAPPGATASWFAHLPPLHSPHWAQAALWQAEKPCPTPTTPSACVAPPPSPSCLPDLQPQHLEPKKPDRAELSARIDVLAAEAVVAVAAEVSGGALSRGTSSSAAY